LTEELFKVWWWDPQGYYHLERAGLTGMAAVQLAYDLAQRPATALGIFRRIIITDAGDCTVFEWKHGEGVTFPTKGDCDAHARTD
jgi:hypothetical protein